MYAEKGETQGKIQHDYRLPFFFPALNTSAPHYLVEYCLRCDSKKTRRPVITQPPGFLTGISAQ